GAARLPRDRVRRGALGGRARGPRCRGGLLQAAQDRRHHARRRRGHPLHGQSRGAGGGLMGYQYLLLQRREPVATITLNRPDAYNALDLGLGRDLFHATLEVDEDPDVRCVVITGAGEAFCAGGDVKGFVENLPRIGVLVKELTTYLHGAVSRLARSSKPVIMAVNGVAAGGGRSLAPSRDVGVAPGSGRFTGAGPKVAA